MPELLFLADLAERVPDGRFAAADANTDLLWLEGPRRGPARTRRLTAAGTTFRSENAL